jgi:hypothetical protein
MKIARSKYRVIMNRLTQLSNISKQSYTERYITEWSANTQTIGDLYVFYRDVRTAK